MSTKYRKQCLVQKVRQGKCNTPQSVLFDYLKYCEEQTEGLNKAQARRIHLSVFNVILETICDDLVARCWRNWCRQNINSTLSKVRYLSSSQSELNEYLALEKKMHLFTHYFLN